MNRRAFLWTGATSTALFLAAPAWCAEPETAGPNDSEILAEAPASIERHRKTDVTVQAQGTDGKPLRGVKLVIEQQRHDFLFGCNLFQFDHCADPDQEEKYRQQFAALFNYCTLGFYWAGYEPQKGKPNYAYTDKVLEWTTAQGIACKGHPLVWDHPAASPPWLPDNPDEIAQLVHDRVRDIVSRYRGRIDIWDVVNEATHLPDGVNKTRMAAWGAALGSLQYVAEPLKIARAANRDATLLVNDYRTDPPYFEILSHLREKGKFLLDAIGIQSHMHTGVWPLRKVHAVCQTYGKLRLPLHFTETTILSGDRDRDGSWGPTSASGEASQAEQAVNFYTCLFAHPAVQALTWWDFSDYHAWQRAPAGMLRADMSPKPLYNLLVNLIKKLWWTRVEGQTNEAGSLDLRAFYGGYRLSAEFSRERKSVSEIQVRRGQSNQFTIRI